MSNIELSDLDIKILTGLTEEHLSPIPGTKLLCHHQALPSLLALQEEAKAKGFDLQVASSFRSYERQLAIWNGKIAGDRPLLDREENVINPKEITEEQLLESLLYWSAIPGTSRHHWGTEFDVFDGNALPTPKYEVQLTKEEVEKGGIFAPLHDWLDERMKDDEFPFYRPYNRERGGVSPERWHLSFAPLGEFYWSLYSFEFFSSFLEQQNFALSEIVRDSKQIIYDSYLANINHW